MLLAAMLMLSASLASCSKGNDRPDSDDISKEKIVGIWKTEIKESSTEWELLYLSFAADGTYEGVIVEHLGSEQEMDEANGHGLCADHTL